MTPVAYLDASALTKIARPETHELACREFLDAGRYDLVSSQIVVTECLRALNRSTSTKLHLEVLESYLEKMFLLSVDDQLVRHGAAVKPSNLRTLDALHIASALRMRGQVTAFVTYDRRQAEAAALAGLPVVSPVDD